MLRRDADTAVLDLDHDRAIVPTDAHVDGAAVAVILDGIVEQIVEDFVELVGIGPRGERRRFVELERQSPRFRQRPDKRRADLRYFGHFDILALDAIDAGIKPGQGQEPFDELVHQPAAAAAFLEGGTVLFRRALLAQRHVGRGEQGRQRRAQLVRDIGGGLFFVLEGFAQLVESKRQALDNRLQLARHGHLVKRQAKILFGNTADGRRETLERRQPAGDQPEAAT